MKNVEITLLTEITSTLLRGNFDGFYFLDLLSSEIGIAADEYPPMDSDGEFVARLLVDLTVADIRQTVDRDSFASFCASQRYSNPSPKGLAEIVIDAVSHDVKALLLSDFVHFLCLFVRPLYRDGSGIAERNNGDIRPTDDRCIGRIPLRALPGAVDRLAAGHCQPSVRLATKPVFASSECERSAVSQSAVIGNGELTGVAVGPSWRIPYCNRIAVALQKTADIIGNRNGTIVERPATRNQNTRTYIPLIDKQIEKARRFHRHKGLYGAASTYIRMAKPDLRRIVECRIADPLRAESLCNSPLPAYDKQ